MAAEDRILKILLQLKADTADSAKVTGSLKEIEAQAVKTSQAVGRVTTGGASASGGAVTESAQARSAAIQGQITQQQAVVNAQKQQELVIEQQKQAILIARFQLVSAEVAGDKARVALLREELLIRNATLNTLRGIAFTEVDLNKALLAQNVLLATSAAKAASMGPAMNFTRGQATALAQQLATGRVSAESISRAFSGFGSYLSIAAVVGYGVYNIFSNLRSLSTELTKDYEDQARELSKQVSVWTDLAHEANSFSDIVKLGEQMLQPLDEFTKKLDEISKRELTFGQKVTDLLGLNQFVGAETNEQAAATGAANQTQVLQERLELAKALLDVAAQSKRAFEAINLLPLADAIDKVTGSSEELRAKHEQLRTEFIDALNKAQELAKIAADRAPYESAEDQRESTKQWQDQLQIARQLYGQLVQTGHALDQNDSRLTSITGQAETLDKKTKDIAEGIRKWELSKLDPSERIPQLNLLLDETLEKLREIGITETDPAKTAAQIQSIDLTKEQKTEANALLIILLEIVKAIRGANEEQANNDERNRREAANAARREQAELERRVRDAQGEVTRNPFLSTADRNAEMIRLLRQEAAAHREAGNEAKAHAAEMEALALTFEGNLQANMMEWVNGFGTSADQVSGVITGTLNSAIAETSRLLTDAIFRTGDWEKAILAVGETFVQQLITMGIQMVIQHTLGEMLKTQSTASTVGKSATVTAAVTPAAVAESGATGGFNWVAAGIAAAAAIALIVGLLAATGGFAKGGRTGSRRRLATVGEEGEEFVFTAGATRNIGVDNLYSLMHAAERAPRFGSGGRANLGLGWELGEYPLPGSEMPNDFFRSPRGSGPTVQINPFGPRYTVGGEIPGHLQGPFAVESGSIEIDLGEDYPTVETPTSPRGGPTWSMDDEPVIFGDPGLNFGAGAGAYVDRTGASGSANFFGNVNSGIGIFGQGQLWDAAATTGVGAGYDASGNFVYNINTSGRDITGSAIFDLSSVGGSASAVIVGQDILTNQPVYRDIITGQLFVEPGTGHAPGYIGYGQSPLSAASQLLMASQAYGGMPNRVDVGDAGRSLFGTPSKGTGYVDEFGFIVRRPGGFIPGGANGLRIPGPPSKADNVLAWLSTGERVIAADLNVALERQHGLDWDRKLDISIPRFADGGRVSVSPARSSAEGGVQRSKNGEVQVFIYDDLTRALRDFSDSPAARKIFKKSLRRNS